MPMIDIEQAAKAYTERRESLSHKVSALHALITDSKRSYLPQIKRALARATEAHAELKAAIEAEPELFTKPKTQIFHGIKVGYAKSKPTITIEDDAKVIAAIKKRLPDLADLLITTKESPAKDAIKALTEVELKAIGVVYTDGSDALVIKPVDSEVDKLVDVLLKDATADDGAED